MADGRPSPQQVRELMEGKKWSYRNTLYIDWDVLEAETYALYEAEDADLLLYTEHGHCNVLWAASTLQALLMALPEAVTRFGDRDLPVLMRLVPEELELELINLGFVQVAEYIDCWLRDLQGLDLFSEIEWEVAAAEADELAEAAAVTRACQGQSRGFGGESEDWVREWVSDPNNTVLVCRDAGRMVGVCMMGMYGFDGPKGPVCWLRELAVLPSHQRRKIGRSLCLAGLRWGKARGATRSFLAVDKQNASAIALYTSLGYRPQPGRGEINMMADYHLVDRDVLFNPPMDRGFHY